MRATMRIEQVDGERERLEAMSRSRTLEGRLVLRAQIIILAAQGLSSRSIGEEFGIDYKTAMRWRNRFIAQRFEGIEQERPGCGRKPRIQPDEVLEVMQRTLQTKPEGATHWSLRRMALKTGLSKSTVHRIWQSRGLKLNTFHLTLDGQSSMLIFIGGHVYGQNKSQT